ncbi:hypothetical protein [Sedimentisphaera salicampi]|uniref:hypothetical protein n=1 Tax=Sedimentisphaera salicampi TaxID=1941349 RepID=UPI000B9BB2E8
MVRLLPDLWTLINPEFLSSITILIRVLSETPQIPASWALLILQPFGSLPAASTSFSAPLAGRFKMSESILI